jgi:phosphoenolpyruvate---glycerone phosphotransferase subunit DhaL
MFNNKDILTWIRLTAQYVEENKDYLTELDRAIGDADHGNNMDRGFKKVMTRIASYEDKDIGSILNMVGMTLISSVGGAAGPLYGAFYLQAAKAINSKTELYPEDIVALLVSGTDGLIKRGKTNPGDKTIIDSLLPGVEALKKSLHDGKDIMAATHDAVSSAEEGMKHTIPLVAKKGRASYLGERSAGHQDPGATSASYILKALLDVLLSR